MQANRKSILFAHFSLTTGGSSSSLSSLCLSTVELASISLSIFLSCHVNHVNWNIYQHNNHLYKPLYQTAYISKSMGHKASHTGNSLPWHFTKDLGHLWLGYIRILVPKCSILTSYNVIWICPQSQKKRTMESCVSFGEEFLLGKNVCKLTLLGILFAFALGNNDPARITWPWP